VRAAVDVVVGRLNGPLVAELAARGVPAPRLRAELLVATVLGIIVTRANGSLPTLAAASADEVLAVLGPAIDALVPLEDAPAPLGPPVSTSRFRRSSPLDAIGVYDPDGFVSDPS
jgi:hypothetical protein